MRQSKQERLTESESLSALSEVDARYLKSSPERLLPDVTPSRKYSSHSKMDLYTGINARDKNYGRAKLHRACDQGNLEKVIDLVEVKGASVHVKSINGVTPLHEACIGGSADVVNYLVKHGAVVNARDNNGDYPLLDAAQIKSLEICQILLEAGANPTIQNAEGKSAISEPDEGPLKDLLRQYSSKFHSPGQNRMKIADVVSLSTSPKKDAARFPDRQRKRRRTKPEQMRTDERGARKVDINGRDQLHQYVIEGEDDLVEEYLAIQDCDYQDDYGNTPLHSAARAGNARICELLLQHNARVTVKNKLGNTALAEACYTIKNKEVILALLDAGASCVCTNLNDMSPIQIAFVELGKDSAEATLLKTSGDKELAKIQVQSKRRALRREKGDSRSVSVQSTPLQSPTVRQGETLPAVSSPKVPPSTPTVGEALSAKTFSKAGIDEVPGVAITIASSAAPQISTRTMLERSNSGSQSTHFLTELRSNSGLSHNDSSIRGLPLPPLPPCTTPRGKENDSTTKKALISIASLTSDRMISDSPELAKRKNPDENSSLHPHLSKRVKSAELDNTDGPPQTVTKDQQSTSVDPALIKALLVMGEDMLVAMRKHEAVMSALLTSVNAMTESQESKR